MRWTYDEGALVFIYSATTSRKGSPPIAKSYHKHMCGEIGAFILSACSVSAEDLVYRIQPLLYALRCAEGNRELVVWRSHTPRLSPIPEAGAANTRVRLA